MNTSDYYPQLHKFKIMENHFYWCSTFQSL